MFRMETSGNRVQAWGSRQFDVRMIHHLFRHHSPPAALRERFVRVLRAMLWFGVASYGAYLGLFWWLRVPSMPTANAGMIVVCLLSLALLAGGRLNLALAAGSAMVLVHAFCATLLFGWNGEFHLYAFLIICVLLLAPTLSGLTKLVTFVAVTAGYAAAWSAWSGAVTPDGITAFFGLANVVVCAMLLAALSAIFSSAIVQTADEYLARNAELAHQATTDPLTGLFNRRYLLDILQQEYVRYQRTAREFAVIIGDIDKFKDINDRHGHHCGDAVLVAIAAALRESVRAPDLIARWGGEEFLVFLPETSLEEALAVATRIQTQLASAPICVGPLRFDVRMTLGVAPARAGGTVDSLLRQADDALYRGKRAGRNRIEVVTGAVAA